MFTNTLTKLLFEKLEARDPAPNPSPSTKR